MSTILNMFKRQRETMSIELKKQMRKMTCRIENSNRRDTHYIKEELEIMELKSATIEGHLCFSVG